jgi:hypothetical protein
MFCKVLCYYTQKDWLKIENILNSLDEKFTIITTNEELNFFLIKKGFSSYTLSEKFFDFDENKQEMEKNIKIKLTEYKKNLKQIKYKNIQIFDGVETKIIDQLTLLEKTKSLLDEKLNFVFIFDYFLYHLFAIKTIAIDLNYIADNDIIMINKNKSKTIKSDSNQKILYLKNFIFFTIPRYLPSNKILNSKQTVMTNKTKKESLVSISKSKHFKNYIVKKAFRIAKINIFTFFYLMMDTFGINSNKIILKKIDKKLAKELSQNSIDEKKINLKNLGAEYYFFLTTNDVDLYLKPIYPILDKFKNENVGFVIFTIDNTTSFVLKDKNISFVDIVEEMHILSKIIKKSTSSKKFIKQIKKIADENNLILFKSHVPDKVWDIFLDTFSVIQICDHIFSNNKIESIVSQIDGDMFGNIADAAAKKFGIPSFTIPAAILNEQLSNSSFYHSEKILLYGTQGYDALRTLGYDKNRLIITGNPSYDFFKQFNHKQSKIFLNDNYNVNKSKKFIVVAMSRWHQDDELWMSKLIQFCNKNNYEVVIKLHPMYQFSERSKTDTKVSIIKSKCKNMKFLITYDNLHLLMAASDLVITEYSNVGPEAIFMGKPVLTVNFLKEDWEGEEHYHESGGVIYLEDYQKMEITIKKIFEDGKFLDSLVDGQKNIINLYNTYNDGKAAERIFNLITNNKYENYS